MEFVAQPEKNETGEFGSVSVVNSNGELVDLAVTPNYKTAKILKDVLDTLVQRHDELLIKKIEGLHDIKEVD
jgi:hypothetical protein